jgi:hypothetical protein
VKCGARVALGVAGGYLLGRTKKMKLALMLGGMAAGRRAGGPGELLSRGTKLLDSSPELSRLVGDVRGRLLEAGKGAALAVATRQVEALTDRVGKRVESLGGGGTSRRGKAEEEPETDGYAEDEYAQDEPAQDEPAQDEAEQDTRSSADQDEEPAEEQAPPPPRRPRAPAKSSAARTGRSTAASATVKRAASGAGRAAGRKPTRTTRTQRSNGDG